MSIRFNRNSDGDVYIKADDLPNVGYRKHVASRLFAKRFGITEDVAYPHVRRTQLKNGNVVYVFSV